MRKFVVPQFIDVENRIFGPITVRQFATMAVAAVFVFAAYKLATFGLFLIWLVVIIIATVVVGFLKINGQPFHIFSISFINSLRKPPLRVWHKEPYQEAKSADGKEKGAGERAFVPKRVFSKETLAELALIIDTGGIYKGEAEANRINRALYEE